MSTATPATPAPGPVDEKRASFEREALVHLDSLYRVALRVIDQLPEQFRETVVLSDVEGLSYEEIARIIDVPVGTVKSRLFRARRLLQRKLYDYAVGMGYIKANPA